MLLSGFSVLVCGVQGSRESEPGFAALLCGELLLILVKFLGMEQLDF